MNTIQRFWSHEAKNIRCTRESDYDSLHAEADALQQRLAAFETLHGGELGLPSEGWPAYHKRKMETLRDLHLGRIDRLEAEAEALRAENGRLKRTVEEGMPRLMQSGYEMRKELEAARGLLREARPAVAYESHRGDEAGKQYQITLAGIDAFLSATPAPEVRQAEQRWSSFDEWLTWELDHGDGTMAAASDAETRLARRLWFCLERAPLTEQGERQEAVEVVVPAKLTGATGFSKGIEDGWNAAIDAVLRLNTTPQPGPDVRGLVEAGNPLSNAAYNLAQKCGHALTEFDCELLSELRKRWDEALAAHRQAQQGGSHDT